MSLSRPDPQSFGPFGKYIRLVPEGDIVAILNVQLNDMLSLLGGTSEAESLVHHVPYTWSLRDVVAHVNDCERIFAYRVLRLARGDATPLPSFDENAYAREAHADRVPLYELVADFEAIRRATIRLVTRLDGDAWARGGVVSDLPMTVAGMVYALVGHCGHHLEIMHSRLGRAR